MDMPSESVERDAENATDEVDRVASSTSDRRMGDAIEIPGDYQHKALTEGPAAQRAWHEVKLGLLDWFFPLRPGDRMLDVGSGSGVFAERMAQVGCEVVGVDANTAAVEYASQTFASEKLSFLHGYLDELELPAASFDGATSIEVIEHVHMPQVMDLLGELKRIVKPGGRVLLTTPNYRGVWPAIEWLADRMGSTAHMDADQHINRFHRRKLVDALAEAGFELERVRTFCTVSPFASAVSKGLGDWIEHRERSIDLPFGSLLAAAARVPS